MKNLLEAFVQIGKSVKESRQPKISCGISCDKVSIPVKDSYSKNRSDRLMNNSFCSLF